MQNTHFDTIEAVINHILPVTELRRNPGEVFKRLQKTGGFIITKDGKPIGKLLPLSREVKSESLKEKRKKLQSLIGGFKLGLKLSPKKINKIIDKSYAQMLSRQ